MSMLWMVASVGVLCEKPWTLWEAVLGPLIPTHRWGTGEPVWSGVWPALTSAGVYPLFFLLLSLPHFSLLPTPLPPLFFLLTCYWQSVYWEGFPFSLPKVLFPWKDWWHALGEEGVPLLGVSDLYMGTVALGHCDKLWWPKVSLSEMPWIKYLNCNKCDISSIHARKTCQHVCEGVTNILWFYWGLL